MRHRAFAGIILALPLLLLAQQPVSETPAHVSANPTSKLKEFSNAPVLALLATFATILSGLAGADQLSKRGQLRRVDELLGSTPPEGSADVPVPPVGLAPPIDLSLDDPPGQEIVFGVMPFIDHSQAFIGQRLGWFAEAGITLTFRLYTPDNAVGALENGEIQVLSAVPSLLIRRGGNPRQLEAFVLHDLFQGYGLMCRSSIFSRRKFKSYKALRHRGISHVEALRKIASYLSGRTVAHSKDDAIAPFLDRIMSSDPTAKRFVHKATDTDADAVRCVVRGMADFQVGGAPSRLTLERLGFRVLVSSRDLIEDGLLFRDSRDYLGLIQCGWFAPKAWIEQNPDLALRMASVSYRISNFICRNPDLAAAIHTRFLNQVAGTSLRPEDIKKAYLDLHPFKSLEDQRGWYYDPSDRLYVKTVVDNIIAYWKSELGTSTFDHLQEAADVVSAGILHKQLIELRRRCIDDIHGLQRKDNTFLYSPEYRAASHLFYSYNYMDCAALLSHFAHSPSHIAPVKAELEAQLPN